MGSCFKVVYGCGIFLLLLSGKRGFYDETHCRRVKDIGLQKDVKYRMTEGLKTFGAMNKLWCDN